MFLPYLLVLHIYGSPHFQELLWVLSGLKNIVDIYLQILIKRMSVSVRNVFGYKQWKSKSGLRKKGFFLHKQSRGGELLKDASGSYTLLSALWLAFTLLWFHRLKKKKTHKLDAVLL